MSKRLLCAIGLGLVGCGDPRPPPRPPPARERPTTLVAQDGGSVAPPPAYGNEIVDQPCPKARPACAGHGAPHHD